MNPIEELIVMIWLGAILGGLFGYALATTGRFTFACMLALLGANIAVIAFWVRVCCLES